MFEDNIWGADLADIQLTWKDNKGIRYLLYAIYLFSKYAWAGTFNHKKVLLTVNAFQSILDCSKPSKIWVDQGTEFYNSSFKKWSKRIT